MSFSIGSSIAVVIHDPEAGVGGILHYMLPLSKANPEQAKSQPAMFGDTGIPALFQALYDLGAVKKNLKVKVCGGAQVMEGKQNFAVGKRNFGVLKKIFKKSGIQVESSDIGGTLPRTVQLELDGGDVTLIVGSKRRSL